jgi:hypothetical protein
MVEMQSEYKFLAENLNGRDHLENLSVDDNVRMDLIKMRRWRGLVSPVIQSVSQSISRQPNQPVSQSVRESLSQ